MNPILENKIEELKNAKNYECWYLVKQPTAFDSLCYLVSFLKKYKSSDLGKIYKILLARNYISCKL